MPLRESDMQAISSISRLDINRIVHEIGNPLNGMATTIQLMERYLALRDRVRDEFIADSLHNLNGEISRLRRILSEARDQSESCIQPEPTDLSHVVAAVLRAQNPEFGIHGIRIVKEVSPDLPPILADRSKLQQALLNLFKNSIEAMPAGGTLKLRIFWEEQFVVLDIADTGVGIPKNVNALNGRRTSKPGGMGLGLSIVREIVTAHGGRISYHTEEGKGTRFRLRFIAAIRGGEMESNNIIG